MVEKKTIKPQAGPQEAFLSTSADIAIYGGGAGGGKSWGLLLEPLRHINNPDFGAVIFRRTTKQVRNEGGLWYEAAKLYGPIGCQLKESTLEVIFHTKMRVQFAHLEHESNIYDWQGAQIPLICFDELTHFTESQFFYLLSRNRSTSGVAGYVRATCNPDKKSWVRKFIDWWIGPKGFPIKERSGKLRWFVRINDKLHWADTREALIKEHGSDVLPKSVTFIAAKLEDNKILMEKDPSYAANLAALPRVERERLKDGNWDVQPSAGTYFKRHEFEIVDAIPAGCTYVRYWDRASTEVPEGVELSGKDPDYTVGLLLAKSPRGVFFVVDVIRFRKSPLKVEAAVKNTAGQDGPRCMIGIEQDPGQAGVADAQNYVRLLSGYNVRIVKPSQDKVTRALPVSAQVEAGNVKLLRGEWNDDFLTEVQNFPDDKHDDQVDTLSGAFNLLNLQNVGRVTANIGADMHRPMAGSLGEQRKW